MKKLAASLSALSFLSFASQVHAAIDVTINQPSQGVTAPPNQVLANAITIIFIVAGLAVLFMLIYGAFQWIMSGGEKEKVEEARKRIMAAIVGIVILALAFVILGVLGGILGFKFFDPAIVHCTDGLCF